MIVLEDDIVYAIIRFHAFTSNDFVSSSFRKGKSTCFNLMLKNPRYKMALVKAGESWDLDEETFNVLQEFVTEPYGIGRAARVNGARYKIFLRKFANEEKTVNMSVLPPCESVLRLCCQRANYLAGIWKRSVSSQSSILSPVYHGWNPDKSLT